jgi:two-component system, sensor histidine kinase ChiS
LVAHEAGELVLAEPQSLLNSIKLGHVLVVDDDAVNRLVVSNYLTLRNYQVSEASSGEEALAIVAQQQNIDLVLLDIMMPKMSGYETCKRMRVHYQAHELPIIFLTARSQTNDLVLGFEAGANDYLTKPIEKEELLARVATHMQLRGATQYLDQKVAERTLELHQKNEGLKQTQRELEQAYKKLEEASLADPLTGLHNRRFLTKSIFADLSLVDREYKNWLSLVAKTPSLKLPENSDLVFILLDVDYFKQVNDSYGHSAGDRVLEQLSRLLQVVLRDSDYLVRWGGEEFLIVVRFCSRHEAPEMVERIRQAVETHHFIIEGEAPLQKTCSIGYAVYPFYTSAPSMLTWEQVIDTADRAMYVAKRSGRNCWVGILGDKILDGHVNPAQEKSLKGLVETAAIHIEASIPQSAITL